LPHPQGRRGGLERRYHAGEGAEFADAGAAAAEFVTAINRADFDRVFDELIVPELRIENRSRPAFPDRSAAELRASVEELDAMVASVRTWNSAVCWLSPTWYVARHEREAVGHDGERYEWTRLLVAEYHDGRLASLCDFDVEDEERAFAYAEERMRATSSRLAVANRSSETLHAMAKALQAHDTDVAEWLASCRAARIGLCMTIVDDSAVTPSTDVPSSESHLSDSYSNTTILSVA
jgi:hypothetical protein